MEEVADLYPSFRHCAFGDTREIRETRLNVSLISLPGPKVALLSPVSGLVPRIDLHTASQPIYTSQRSFHNPIQSSVARPFSRYIHCRDCLRNAIRQLLLPLWAFGALSREILDTVIEAMEKAIRLAVWNIESQGVYMTGVSENEKPPNEQETQFRKNGLLFMLRQLLMKMAAKKRLLSPSCRLCIACAPLYPPSFCDTISINSSA